MVDSEGIGFQDFTSETAISGTASVSGNVVGISGDISISGTVSIIGNYTYRPGVIVITGASGGQPLGSGLTTSGYVIQNVKIKSIENKISGVPNYSLLINSGLTTPYIYIGGTDTDRPYPGSGFVCSGKGLLISPGESIVVSVLSLDDIYATSESSGNPISYIVEMR